MPGRDFTLNAYSLLLTNLSERAFQRFCEFCTNSAAPGIILRHDVDALPQHSLRFAQIQHSLGIRGTYYFRIIPESLQPRIIEEIANLGHEIGYHYEDVSLAAASLKYKNYRTKDPEIFRENLLEKALDHFTANLAVLRKYADIHTICMHGSPLSPWDSRLLWTKYDYHDFGLIGEPYFDIDFNRVAYYTDTGRRWDGDRFSLRDQPLNWSIGQGKKLRNNASAPTNDAVKPSNRMPFPAFHSTADIITAARHDMLPQQVMFTFHPQRWHDKMVPWLAEWVMQNTKNMAKYVIKKRYI